MIKNTSNQTKILPTQNNNLQQNNMNQDQDQKEEKEENNNRHSSMEKGLATTHNKSSEINEIRYGSFLLGNSSSSFCIIS